MAVVTVENVYHGMPVYVARYNRVTGESKILLGLVYKIRKDAADIVIPNDPKRNWFKYGEAFTTEDEASLALERYLEDLGEADKLSKVMKPGDLVRVRTPEFYDDGEGNHSKTYGYVVSVGRTRFKWKTKDGEDRTVLTGKGQDRYSSVWEHPFERIILHVPIQEKQLEEA